MTKYWPTTRRAQVAVAIALGAFIIASIIASSRLLRIIFQDLDLIAYAGLFLACWIGAGGALVPVPGVRALSWLMVVQQGAALDPVLVAGIAASAMVIGQSSYFFAARAASHRLSTDKGASDDARADAGPEPDGDDAPGPDPLEEPDAAPEQVSRRARAMRGARERVTRQVHEHGILTVFVVTSLPTPLTTLTTSTAAASGMRFPIFFGAAYAGYLLWCSILALFGQGLLALVQGVFPIR